jgi:glycosyltransferase involved in cell wall biosynthesis
MPKVSVLMPSYNHEKFIEFAINSVISQSFNDWELIIVDDCSTDKTFEIASKFKDKRIKVFQNKINSGTSATINECIKKSVGKYLAPIASDDAFLPDKLEKQVAVLDENSMILSCFTLVECIDKNNRHISSKFWDGLAQINYTKREEFLRHFFLRGNFLNAGTEMFRRSLLDKISGYDVRLLQLQDFDHHIKKCLSGEICLLKEKLFKYRTVGDESNLSAPKPSVIIRTSIETKQVLDNYLAIDKYDFLCKIFPEIEKFGKKDNKLCSYYLARFAAESPSSICNLWGVDILYKLLADEKTAKYIFNNTDFSYKKLFEITGKKDVFKSIKVTFKQKLKKNFNKMVKKHFLKSSN